MKVPFLSNGSDNNNGKMNRFYPAIQSIQYRPDAGPEDTLCYHHYNPTENIHGKPMEEWFKFSPCFFNSFRYMGGNDYYGDRVHQRHREWEDDHNHGTQQDRFNLETYRNRMRAAFEFCQKLGVKYYAASDRDFAPDLDNWEKSNRSLEEMVILALELQKQTGIHPLYFSADLFSHPRYMCGASSNPDVNIFVYACAQIKRAMDMAKRLNAENFVFFNPRDGYQHTYMRNIFQDMSHMANMYRMAVQYKEKIGFRGQLLIQPKPMDPQRHQYESDAMATMQMLRHFGMEKQFRLYIKPAWSAIMNRMYEHDVYMASAYHMLGMIGASDSYEEINSTSDLHARDVRQSTTVMKCIIEQNGLQNGGFILDGRLRRESWEPRDMFYGHILTMDTYARGLKNAARIVTEAIFAKSLQKHTFKPVLSLSRLGSTNFHHGQPFYDERYITYKSGIGERLDKGSSSLEECEAHIRKGGEPETHSDRSEHFTNMFNYYVYPQAQVKR